MAAAWALAVGAAVLIKLSSSVDDVAWLLPFIAQPQRWTNFRRAAQYVTTMLIVGCVASAIATGGGAAVSAATGANSDWQAERVLGLISGLALALYGLYLFKGWWDDRQEERLARKVAEEQVSAPRSEPSRSRVVAPLPAGHGLPAEPVDQVRAFDEVDVEAAPAGVILSEAAAKRANHSRPIARAELAAPAPAASSPDGDTNAPTELTARRLFVVSVLGSLDDLAVQISLLLAGTFTVAQLLVGLVIGSSLVVCFCLFVTLFKPLTALIQLVPLFAVVFAFAIYTLVAVSLFEPDVVALLSPAMPPPAMPPPAVPPSSTGRLLRVVAPPMLLPVPPPPPSTRDDEARLLGGGLPPTGDQFGVYWTAGALALGSSTDNFAIGASLGISGLMLKLKFNALIAAANALGAFVAAAGGLAIGQMANSFGLWIAAFVFGYLAWQEGGSLWAGEPASPLQKIAAQANGNMAIAVQLAVPMTLNNLAGGIAGGVVGISPWLLGTSAFCASFAMMATGFFVGQRLHSVLRGSQLDVRLFSCSIFVTLAYEQVSDKASHYGCMHALTTAPRPSSHR